MAITQDLATFGAPYIDVDEWRDEPVPHRYVHGGFHGPMLDGTALHLPTDLRFSFYFPPKAAWAGRFLHHLEGAQGGHENVVQLMDLLPFAVEQCGAYVVESNHGWIGGDLLGDPTMMLPGLVNKLRPTLIPWAANEVCARYARELATAMYGEQPAHGYLWGISGGGGRTIVGLEQVESVWDGGVGVVPFISAADFNPLLAQTSGALLLHGLGAKLDVVADAWQPGGDGDPWAKLDSEERTALERAMQLGWAPGALYQPAVGSFFRLWITSILPSYDPEYFEDFWTTPGYAGADGELDNLLTEVEAVVTHVDASDSQPQTMLVGLARRLGTPVVLILDEDVPDTARYGTATVVQGASAGSELLVVGRDGDRLVCSASGAAPELAKGDRLAVTNRAFLAWANYHRYVPGGVAQRTGPSRTVLPLGGQFPVTGRFHGHLILLPSLWDAAAPAIGSTHYAALAESAGNGDRLRIWVSDNAEHASGDSVLVAAYGGDQDQPGPAISTRVIGYAGIYEQALLDLIEWVERGTEPPASTAYSDAVGHLELEPSAENRGGLQPIVAAFVEGGTRAMCATGDTLSFTATVTCPPGTGTVVAVEWDFDGSGQWAFCHDEVDGTAASCEVTASHSYARPGTYFAAVRATAHRKGDADAATCRIENLGRVRVEVH